MASRMNVSFLQELLNSIAEQGRHLLPRSLGGSGREDDITELATALVSNRGEASGVAIARELLRRYRGLMPEDRLAFLKFLARTMQPDPGEVAGAARAYLSGPSTTSIAALQRAVESPRLEFFRRLNLAPGATAEIVAMRRDLIAAHEPSVAPVDADLRHLLASWFNRGFLVLRRIDWQTPAAILEKIIAYEAVHEIQGWDDLRRRLASDRRCFAFFHPALPDDPLIFIEVALVDRLSAKIEPIIRAAHPDDDDLAAATASTAVFYSISNCQPGLKGVSFGNFLIKQVAADLARELPALTTFSTLSPIPSLRTWIEDPATALERHLPRDLAARVLAETKAASLREGIARLAATAEAEGYADATLLSDVLVRLAAHLVAGTGTEKGPRDPVARFHLGNGARIERINWMADLSRKGVRESYGLMVNYLYDLASIEANHEAFANRRPVATSRSVAELLDLGDVSARPRSLLEQVDAAIGLRTRKS